MRLAAAIEENAYLRIDAGAAVSLEINGVLKREPVGPGRRIWLEIAATPISIRDARCDRDPLSTLTPFKRDGNRRCRLSQHSVEHMRRDSTHSTSHFPRRISVICRCCSAASRNSVSRSLANRRLRMASISSALFPVAQTIYVKPKRCS